MVDAIVIDGQAIAARLRKAVAEATAALRGRHGITPGLAAVIVGNDAASQIYVRNKARACLEAGLASFEHRLPGIVDMRSIALKDDRYVRMFQVDRARRVKRPVNDCALVGQHIAPARRKLRLRHRRGQK